MTTNRIIETLINEKNYDRVQTEKVESKIDSLSSDIKEALIDFVESGNLTSPEYSGYTVERILKAKPGMTELGAYLALDWIRREPKTAIKAIITPVMKFTPKVKE